AERVHRAHHEERQARAARGCHGFVHDARHGDAAAELHARGELAGRVPALCARARDGRALGPLVCYHAAGRLAVHRSPRRPGRRMRRALLVVTALAACVVAGAARADGDPASDYLLASQTFIPFDLKLSEADQLELTSLVSDTNKAGYKVRVALIGSAYDLGAVTSLWRKPRPYARFLGAELAF